MYIHVNTYIEPMKKNNNKNKNNICRVAVFIHLSSADAMYGCLLPPRRICHQHLKTCMSRRKWEREKRGGGVIRIKPQEKEAPPRYRLCMYIRCCMPTRKIPKWMYSNLIHVRFPFSSCIQHTPYGERGIHTYILFFFGCTICCLFVSSVSL